LKTTENAAEVQTAPKKAGKMPIDGFCTIVTQNYVPLALALNASLVRYRPTLRGAILVVDTAEVRHPCPSLFPKTHFLSIADVIQNRLAEQVVGEFSATSNQDALRWALKPILLQYLLTEGEIDRTLYCDSDMHFFADPAELFDRLSSSSVVLLPHWRCIWPEDDSLNFEKLFTEGLFNAGLFGASAGSAAALEWWGRVCLFRCVKDPVSGSYDDQKYLDAMSALFEGVTVFRHPGYNVGEWNRRELHRARDADGGVTIAGSWPLVCVHFTRETCLGIANGADALLKPHMATWEKTVKNFSPDFTLQAYCKNSRKASSRFRNKLRWALLRASQFVGGTR